jgi:hypothetical protein
MAIFSLSFSDQHWLLLEAVQVYTPSVFWYSSVLVEDNRHAFAVNSFSSDSSPFSFAFPRFSLRRDEARNPSTTATGLNGRA